MTETVRLEIDTSPGVYLSSKEFTGQLVDSQLFRSLFRVEDDAVYPELLEVLDRPDAHTWVCQARADGEWHAGERISGVEIVARILRVTRESRGGWLTALLKRVELRGERHVLITTRFPIGSLERILASPTFAPRRTDSYSGNYELVDVTATRTTFVPRDKNAPDVQLITTRTREEGRRLFLSGQLDVCWGIGVPTSFWSSTDDGPFDAAVPLDLYAVVVAGAAVPSELVEVQLAELRLGVQSVPGVEATNSRFAVPSRVVHGEGLVSHSSPRALYYTPFPPNHRIATVLAERSEGRLIPHPITYEQLLSSSQPDDGFSLQIHAARFPGMLGAIPEAIYLARGILGNSVPGLRDLAREAWRSRTDAETSAAGAGLEHDLDRLLRRRVVGRLLARFRSAAPLKISRHGLFDFRQLTKRMDDT